MEDKKYTFKEILDEQWGTSNDDGDLHIKVKKENDHDVNHATVALFSFCWGDYKPVSHSMKDEEAIKLYKMLMKSKEMYKFIEQLDTPEAKAIIEEINNGVEPKDDFRDDDDEEDEV
ncbi:MAG TPA: hypothetical protein VNX68_07650 [Nitrosopumilaceae archaeon]|jgi:hypothetical protein|nr:hypothetical protein [Nitrosopumilaceae archaeon]